MRCKNIKNKISIGGFNMKCIESIKNDNITDEEEQFLKNIIIKIKKLDKFRSKLKLIMEQIKNIEYGNMANEENFLKGVHHIKSKIVPILLSLDDANFGSIDFIMRLKFASSKDNQNIFRDEMVMRLKKAYKLLGRNFFIKCGIPNISNIDFMEMIYEDQVLFYLSVHNKIKKVFGLFDKYFDSYIEKMNEIKNMIIY